MSIKTLLRRFSPRWGSTRPCGSRKRGSRGAALSEPRKLRVEQFEERVLLDITGPQLVTIIPNMADSL